MKVARAFAPANVSCIFRTYHGATPEETGSHGVGFTLTEGVKVEVQEGKSEIAVRGESFDFDTVQDVIDDLAPSSVSVQIDNYFPFGSGFGMSGASALAVAFALNDLFSLGKTREELGLVAHKAEVKNRTGLGDVAGQLRGGIMLRVDEGEPLSVKRLAIEPREIYYQVFGPIETKKVISSEEKRSSINRAGSAALESVRAMSAPSFEEIVELSKIFSYESGLLVSQKIIDVIDQVEAGGGKASMIMLGEAVFSTIPFPGSQSAQISVVGARLL